MIEEFLKALVRPVTKRIGLYSLSWLLISLPGQNSFQTLAITTSDPVVRGVTIELPPKSDYPVWNGNEQGPSLSARGAMVIDVESGAVLLEKNSDIQMMPASTTKIMTAMVAMEEYSLDEVVEVKNEDESIGSSSDLVKGERMSVENLLNAMLISSGNDAALTLAQHYEGGYGGFVEAMNKKARDWHMGNTFYKNVSGVEQFGHVTSVRDMAILTKEALKKPLFVEIVGTKQKTISSVDGQIEHALNNINELLGSVEGIRGVKTGFTRNSGECLVAYVERDGREIITVVLGSSDRFGETTALIEWAYGNHEWLTPN